MVHEISKEYWCIFAWNLKSIFQWLTIYPQGYMMCISARENKHEGGGTREFVRRLNNKVDFLFKLKYTHLGIRGG